MRSHQQMFNPALQPEEILRETMLERETELGIIGDALGSMAEGGSVRSFIIIGPRGMGKTHLLLVIRDLIRTTEDLSSRFTAIKFAEEEYSIDSLAFLFIRVLQELANDTQWAVHHETIHELLEQADNLEDMALVDRCDQFLEETLGSDGSKLVLLADNLDDILRNISEDDGGLSKLRSIMQTKGYLVIIGTAPTYFSSISNHREPFYNFFEVIRLTPLSPEGVEQLILKLAEMDGESRVLNNIEELRPRIRTIVHFTSGIPRMVRMLYHVIAHTEMADVKAELERLLDELTPYYQSRMALLTRQQQKIIDTMASMDGPSTPTEIARRGRMDRAVVNAQLKKLLDMGFVQHVKQKKRKTRRYDITERMFRIWREMRMDKEGHRVMYLAEFLRAYYTPSEIEWHIEHVSSRLAKCVDQGTPSERIRYIQECDFLKAVLTAERRVKFEMDLIERYIELGELPKAEEEISHLKRMAEEGKGTKIDADRLFQLESSRYEAALKKKTDDFVLRMEYAWFLYRNGIDEKVMDHLDILINSSLFHEEASLLKSIILYKQGQYVEIVEVLKNITPRSKLETSLMHLVLSLSHYNLHEIEDSFDHLKIARELDPGDTNLKKFQATLLLLLDRYQDVLIFLDENEDLDPKDYTVLTLRASALLGMKEFDLLFELANEMIHVEPEIDEGYMIMALGKLGVHEHIDCRQYLEQALVINPENEIALELIADYAMRDGDFNEARAGYQRVVELEPDDIGTAFKIGISFIFEGNELGFKDWYTNTWDASETGPSVLGDIIWSEDYAISSIEFLEKHNGLFNGMEGFKGFQGQMTKFLSYLMRQYSVDEFRNENYQRAEENIMYLIQTPWIRDMIDINTLMIRYLIELAAIDVERSREMLDRIGARLGDDFTSRFQTFEKLVDYMATRDDKILEALYPEEREIIEEMLERIDEIGE